MFLRDIDHPRSGQPASERAVFVQKWKALHVFHESVCMRYVGRVCNKAESISKRQRGLPSDAGVFYRNTSWNQPVLYIHPECVSNRIRIGFSTS